MNLDYNDIETLPSGIFETFLDAHQRNMVCLYGSPIICDGRVKWLKDRIWAFQNYVRNPNCVNDPGHNVFTSNLVV